MDRIAFDDPAHGAAIAQYAGATFAPDRDHSVCRLRDGMRLGGLLYTGYTGESIQIHTAGWVPHWVNRDLIFVAFDYPFNQLGVNRIFGQVPEDNLRARRFNEKVGLKVIARIEGVYRNNVACLVMRLEREECRFFNVKPRNLIRNLH